MRTPFQNRVGDRRISQSDGLKGLRVDEVFDDDNDADLDDDLSAGSWRLMEERFYQEGIVANLAYKRVTTYANAHSTTVDAENLYYYGYDQVGNVRVVVFSGANPDDF